MFVVNVELQGILEAHHIIPKGKYPEFELELENGVTLCGNCHTLLKGREETEDMKKFLLDDAKIGKQLAALVKTNRTEIGFGNDGVR